MTAPESTTDCQKDMTSSPTAPDRQTSVLASIALYLLIVFAAGALIAPRLHASVEFAAAPHWRVRRALGSFYEYPRSFLESLARQPFHRFVSRCLLLMALVGLP